MPGVLSRKDIEILEERGLHKASSRLSKLVKRLMRQNRSVRIGHIKDAHKIIFTTTKQFAMAGKYRRTNGPEVERIDGTSLAITDWRNIPNEMSILDVELRDTTLDIKTPRTEQEYEDIVFLSARLSHRLACIHPFENGNGRSSRLLVNAILVRAGLSAIPFIVSKLKYLQAMRQADDGDFIPLERIITDGLIGVKKNNLKVIQRKQAELSKD